MRIRIGPSGKLLRLYGAKKWTQSIHDNISNLLDNSVYRLLFLKSSSAHEFIINNFTASAMGFQRQIKNVC